MMKRLLSAVGPAPSALSCRAARAHGGARAGHGGAVATASDRLEARRAKPAAGAGIAADLTTSAAKANTVRCRGT